MGGVKRVFAKGEYLPDFLKSNCDMLAVELKDGRYVVLSGLEIIQGQRKGWTREETAEKVADYVNDPDPYSDKRMPWPLR